MLSWTQVALFSAAAVVLIFTPGPDIIYVMTRGMAQGRRAALAAAAGFSLGNIVHTLAAVLGLSALLTSSATAFAVVKLAGAAYLVYLGIRLIKSGSVAHLSTNRRFVTPGAIFRQSVVANVLNPKVAVFFLAFFPQFVAADRGHAGWQMLLLGLTFVVLTFMGFSMVALGAGQIGRWLNRRPAASGVISKAAGSILIGLGLKLAWPQS